MKTASRILGTAFFLEGFEVQDAPRYGAERRGAPIFAYVRASREPINERGIIRLPHLILVADETLVPVPAASVLSGISKNTLLLIHTLECSDTWQERLNTPALILVLPATKKVEEREDIPFVGAACVGAAARLVGEISQESLIEAIHHELVHLGPDIIQKNIEKAMDAYNLMAAHEGCIKEGEDFPADAYEKPDWVELPFEEARVSAPAIHAAANSVEVKTGLWRTIRPVIDLGHCNRCWWICSTFCPDRAINVTEEGFPQIDYDHCKGCLICVAQCPPHAIEAIPELECHVPMAEGERS
jgi:pyruvate ferredoxin oxidoreductase gamma subunit